MTKEELKNKIKKIVKQKYKSKNSINLDKNNSSISLEKSKYPLINSFSLIEKPIIELLTPQYELFIDRIEWVSPKPLTFRVVLLNDQYFYLIYNKKSWTANVSNKNYYLLNIQDVENASTKISKMLYYEKPISKEGMGEENNFDEDPFQTSPEDQFQPDSPEPSSTPEDGRDEEETETS
jgi:hypothetical protein